MDIPKLPLDGIVTYKNWMETRGIKEGTSDDPNTLFRIFSVVHAALALVIAVVKQTVRALMHLVSLNPKRMRSGAKDLVAVLVQAFALPVIGIAYTVNPKVGASWANKFIAKHSSASLEIGGPKGKRAAHFVGGLCALPVMLTKAVADSLSRGLTFKARRHIKWIPTIYGRAVFMSAINTCSLGILSALADPDNLPKRNDKSFMDAVYGASQPRRMLHSGVLT